jgi:hypothetical protein
MSHKGCTQDPCYDETKKIIESHRTLLAVCKKIQENLPHLYARAGVWPTENTFTKELSQAIVKAEGK